jgi:hypothetical protein
VEHWWNGDWQAKTNKTPLHTGFDPEGGGIMFLQNVGIQSEDYTTKKARKTAI